MLKTLKEGDPIAYYSKSKSEYVEAKFIKWVENPNELVDVKDIAFIRSKSEYDGAIIEAEIPVAFINRFIALDDDKLTAWSKDRIPQIVSLIKLYFKENYPDKKYVLEFSNEVVILKNDAYNSFLYVKVKKKIDNSTSSVIEHPFFKLRDGRETDDLLDAASLLVSTYFSNEFKYKWLNGESSKNRDGYHALQVPPAGVENAEKAKVVIKWLEDNNCELSLPPSGIRIFNKIDQTSVLAKPGDWIFKYGKDKFSVIDMNEMDNENELKKDWKKA